MTTPPPTQGQEQAGALPVGDRVIAAARAICTDRCAAAGDKPCFKLDGFDIACLATCEAETGCFDLARAALTAAQSEPEGWVLVPRNPSREMWAASGDRLVAFPAGTVNAHHDKITAAVWCAMLAAVPSPKETG